MPLLAMPFPAIDPIAIEIGPLAIRWYALAYLAGLIGGWRYLRHVGALSPQAIGREQTDDLLVWATLGVVLGGRLGYVLFYQPAYYLAHPAEILAVWQGGMAFHGGLIGVVLAIILFARRHSLPVLALGDRVAVVAPIGLFFGRIANFINGELFGRVGDVAWAMVFPRGGPLPRHPSQLYEAALEGLLLFIVLAVMARSPAIRTRAGLLGGVFCAGYALSRGFVEFFREPDAHLGFILPGITMGQLLSLPLLLFGLGLIIIALRRRAE